MAGGGFDPFTGGTKLHHLRRGSDSPVRPRASRMRQSRHTGPILLFGAEGQTGRELRRALATLGPVIPLTRRDVDLADAAALSRAVRTHTPSLIVNAAAYNAVDRAEEEADLAMAINGTAPGVLAEEAKRAGAAVVHYSSDYVFGTRVHRTAEGAPRPFREDDPPEPLSAYGRSKLAGEEAIGAVGGAHLILRTSWVYSTRGRTFLAALLRLDLPDQQQLAIVDDQHSCPTWASSLADATAQILAACWALGGAAALRDRGGTYNLAGDGWCSRYDFAVAAFALHAARGRSTPSLRPVPSAEFPTLASRPPFSALDTRAVREAFGVGVPEWRMALALCLAGIQ